MFALVRFLSFNSLDNFVLPITVARVHARRAASLRRPCQWTACLHDQRQRTSQTTCIYVQHSVWDRIQLLIRRRQSLGSGGSCRSPAYDRRRSVGGELARCGRRWRQRLLLVLAELVPDHPEDPEEPVGADELQPRPHRLAKRAQQSMPRVRVCWDFGGGGC